MPKTTKKRARKPKPRPPSAELVALRELVEQSKSANAIAGQTVLALNMIYKRLGPILQLPVFSKLRHVLAGNRVLTLGGAGGEMQSTFSISGPIEPGVNVVAERVALDGTPYRETTMVVAKGTRVVILGDRVLLVHERELEAFFEAVKTGAFAPAWDLRP